MRYTIVSILIYLSHFLHAAGQDDPLVPTRIEIPPVIDGILDDQAWEGATSVTGFKTFIPDFGHDMEDPTFVYMAYDPENLYFAYRCYDSEPDRIKASINSRDNIGADDWICINLDSYNDQQALYAFYVNPLGIQADTRYAAGVEDPSIDYVWYSAGTIDDEGYSIEIQIPLKSIRFTEEEPVQMSVMFERHVSRISVQGMYPEMDPSRGYAFLTQMKVLEYHDVKHYRLFELLPAFTYSARNVHREGEWVKDERIPKLSLTAKYGITSQLILDGTLNPDFSQVEADAGQVDVNLRYKNYYPEKRSFFLEGNENFNVAATRSDEYDPVLTLVHTRSVIDPLAGIKLTGKVTPGLTLAALYALDRIQAEDKENTGEFSHFPALRLKHKLGSDGFLGGIYTGNEGDTTYNRVAGLDGQLRVGKGSTIEYNALLSQTKPGRGINPLIGHLVSGEFKHDSRNILISLGGKDIKEDFIVDAGFIRRTGVTYFKGIITPKVYPKGGIVSRWDFEFFSRQMHDNIYNMWETADHLAIYGFFRGSTSIKVKFAYGTEVFLGERFKMGGIHGLIQSQIGKKFSWAVLYRQRGAVYYSLEPAQGLNNNLVAMVNYKPSENLHLDLSYTYSDFFRSPREEIEFNYSIGRVKVTYQMNRYFFLRAITEYNSYHESLLTDFLASFTYIPGTVVHLGYGSLYERVEWDGDEYLPDRDFLETQRGFFFKASYLIRF